MIIAGGKCGNEELSGGKCVVTVFKRKTRAHKSGSSNSGRNRFPSRSSFLKTI